MNPGFAYQTERSGWWGRSMVQPGGSLPSPGQASAETALPEPLEALQ